MYNNFLSRTAYQSLHKASNQARHYNYIANNGLTHSWLEHYRHANIRSNQIYVNEWNQMDEILSHRSDSPHLYQPYVIFIQGGLLL
jgi:protein phosphatase slingshot